MNTASEAKLIPAPLDEKNLTTDWIEEVFDNYSCSCGGKRNNVYTGIVEDCPVSCFVTHNRVMWHVDPHIGGVPNAGHAYCSLISRLKDLFDEDENPGIVVEYDDSMKDGYFLVQTFYFKDEEQ